MGSSSSKASRAAAGAAARKYPTRVPPPPTSRPSNAPSPPASAGQQSQPGPKVRPQPSASETKDEAISQDASDPQLQSRLRTLGAVQPNPILSHSTTSPTDPSTRSSPYAPDAPTPFPQPDFASSPALQVLRRRQELQDEADRENDQLARLGKGMRGRKFLDIVTLRQVLMLRDEKGVEPGEIERQLGLRPGLIGKLGAKGVVEVLDT